MDSSTVQVATAMADNLRSKYLTTALGYLTADQSQLMQQLLAMHQDLNTTARKQWTDYVNSSFAELGRSNATGLPPSVSEGVLTKQLNMKRQADRDRLLRGPDVQMQAYAAAPIDVNTSVRNYANNLNTQWAMSPLANGLQLPMGGNAYPSHIPVTVAPADETSRGTASRLVTALREIGVNIR